MVVVSSGRVVAFGMLCVTVPVSPNAYIDLCSRYMLVGPIVCLSFDGSFGFPVGVSRPMRCTFSHLPSCCSPPLLFESDVIDPVFLK